MEYEQFFTTVDDKECDCYSQIKIALVGMSVVALLLDCVYSWRVQRNLVEENKSLKHIISKSIERVVIKNLKNGYDITESDEE